jgi:hypothetical protein
MAGEDFRIFDNVNAHRNMINMLCIIIHLFLRRVVNMGIRVYYTLSDIIKTLDHFMAFKLKVKSFLLDHLVYSINEFYCFR